MEGHDPEIVVEAAWWYMALYLPTYFASLFVANMFQGRLEIIAWNLVRATVPTLYLAGIVVLGFSIAAEAPEFAAANVFAMLCSAALGIALLVRRGWFGLRPDAGEAKALLVYGTKSHASEILHSLRQKLDQAVVAKLMTASDLGIYAVALTVANGPLILVQTISNIAFPKISSQATHDGKVLVFGRYLRLALAMVLAINIVLWIVNPWVIPLLFGRAFAPAVLIADVCLLGLVPYAAKLLFAAALKASDRALVIPRAEIWGLVVVAPALFLLVPQFGLIGAATSLVIAQAATALVLGQRLAEVMQVRLLSLMIPSREDFCCCATPSQGDRPCLTPGAARHGCWCTIPAPTTSPTTSWAGCRQEGYDAWFETGFFYAPNGRLAGPVARLPAGLRARVERELKRRSNPVVDPARVIAWPGPSSPMSRRRAGGIGGERLARIIGWRNEMMDRRVARHLRRTPRAW
jgi:hypothetical protein